MEQRYVCPKCGFESSLRKQRATESVPLPCVCGHFLEPEKRMPPVSPVISKETWFQETGPQSFAVGVSRRSWLFFAFGLLLGAMICLQFGDAYKQFAHHVFRFSAFLYFLQHITGLFVAAGIAAMSMWGKTTVTVNGNDAVAFTGISSVGWRCRFDWRHVQDIRSTKKPGRYIDAPQITIVAQRRINVAAGVRKKRREFMLAVLRQKWREPGH